MLIKSSLASLAPVGSPAVPGSTDGSRVGTASDGAETGSTAVLGLHGFLVRCGRLEVDRPDTRHAVVLSSFAEGGAAERLRLQGTKAHHFTINVFLRRPSILESTRV